MKLKKIIYILSLSVSLLAISCNHIDSSRIPAMPVNIQLDNTGLWNTYGVFSYGQYRMFIKSKKLPSNFSYSALSYTGFGGVLLISGNDNGDYNTPLAYDLACPVEAKESVIVGINSKYEAVCPVCGSVYNVCEGYGAPVSGRALDLHYGLQRFRVYPASLGGYIIGR